VLCRGGRCRAPVHQLLGDGIYPKVETLQGARFYQRNVARLSKHDVVAGSSARNVTSQA
jgi:hypothetical protein